MKTIKSILKKYFVAGVLALAPIGLTVWLIKALIGAADFLFEIHNAKFFFGLVPERFHPEHLLGFNIPFLGFFFTLIFIPLVGLITRNVIGRQLVCLGEDLVKRIPFIRSIYNTVKQLLETTLQQGSRNFRKVVVFEYPRKGIYSLAFVTGKNFDATVEGRKVKLISLFVPTTPNPTSGYYMLLPEEDITYVDITTEEAFRLIISFGIVTPDHLNRLTIGSKAGHA